MLSKIYKNYDSLKNTSMWLMEDAVNRLKNMGYNAVGDRLFSDAYGEPLSHGALIDEFPIAAVLMPYISHVGIDSNYREGDRRGERVYVSILLNFLNDRNMRFLVYPVARKPSDNYSIVTSGNCASWLQKSCEDDARDLTNIPHKVMELAPEKLNPEYATINKLCNAGETLLVTKASCHLLEALPSPAESIAGMTGRYLISAYVIFSTSKAKLLFKAKKEEAKLNGKGKKEKKTRAEDLLKLIKSNLRRAQKVFQSARRV